MALLLITFLGFISLGLPDAATGVAWPFIRDGFVRQQADFGLMLLCSSAGYLVSALMSGRILARCGVATVLTVSTLFVALGLVGYASAPRWPFLLAAGPLIGIGSGAIDAGLNSFAARYFSAKHMSWLHGFYGVGASAGPAILTLLMSRGLSWQSGYLTLATLQVGMAGTFFVSRRIIARAEKEVSATREDSVVPSNVAAKSPYVWLQIALFFVYSGSEVAIGQWSFTTLKEGEGVTTSLAGLGTTLYWSSLTGGRFALGFVVERIGSSLLLRGATVAVLIGSAGFALGGISLKLASLVLMGAALAPIYPALMSESPRRLGAAISMHAIGWQAAGAMLGALLVPGFVGVVVRHAGLGAVGVVAIITAVMLLVLHELLLHVRR